MSVVRTEGMVTLHYFSSLIYDLHCRSLIDTDLERDRLYFGMSVVEFITSIIAPPSIEALERVVNNQYSLLFQYRL